MLKNQGLQYGKQILQVHPYYTGLNIVNYTGKLMVDHLIYTQPLHKFCVAPLLKG